jgi:hypothetical protein
MRQTIAVVILAMGSMVAAQGAEKIRWDQIPAMLGPFGTAILGFKVNVTSSPMRRSSGHTECLVTEIRSAWRTRKSRE